MIYEFLYIDKPLTVWLPIALFIGTGGLLAITVTKNKEISEISFLDQF